MKKRLAKLIATGLLILVPAVCSADFQSGNELYSYCTDTAAVADTYCIGYIEGIADTMRHDNNQVCGELYHVTGTQVKDITVQFLQQHPEQRQYAAESLVRLAMSAAFPCR